MQRPTLDPSGPRMMAPFFIPVSMHHGMIRGSGRGLAIAPGGGPGTFAVRPTQIMPPLPMKTELAPPIQLPPPVVLYLCSTTKTATEPPLEEDSESTKEKASLEVVEHSYKELNTRKIKDSLSSFLPDIPGEFDSDEPIPDTTLRGLIDRPPIGGKEFLPLSGQALLGFRLLPGAPLPEPYKMDPPSLEHPKHHHKKRKHKHRAVDKTEDSSDSLSLSSQPSKIPSDAYSFIKQEPPMLHPIASSHPQPPHSHPLSTFTTGAVGMSVPVGSKVISGHAYSSAIGQGPSIAPAPVPLLAGIDPSMYGNVKKKKKEKKKDKDKEKRKKEKKKKKEKHHSQDLPSLVHTSHPTPPPLIPHSSSQPYTQHQHTHTHPHPPT